MAVSTACLHVCITCRAGLALAEGETPAGALLHDEITRQLALRDHPSLTVQPVKCLSSCTRGAAACISMPGKWSYLLGDLNPALVPDLLDYCDRYVTSATGTVLPSKRAASLQGFILGRMPGQPLDRQEIAA
jgi:predicted metal-binding protein